MLQPTKEMLEIRKKMNAPGITDEEWLALEKELAKLLLKRREELKDCPFAH